MTEIDHGAGAALVASVTAAAATGFELRVLMTAFTCADGRGPANGYKEFRSSGLNYDSKLHLSLLDPIDLYVRHTSAIANQALKLLLPLLESYDATLPKFANYNELWSR